MKKKYKVAISSFAAVALIAGFSSYYALGYSKKSGETKTYTFGDGASLKVGILSDTQLPANGVAGSSQLIATKKTLEYLKAKDVQVIIHAGDFTDLGTKEAWQSFKDTYDSVFGSDKPVPLFVMGNHDFWLDMFVDCYEIATPAKMQRRFTEYTGEYPYSHKVINGYHFIGWSSSNGSYDLSYTNETWIREQLDAAVADAPDKPIFVMTHLNPQDTVYGSDDWGNKDIYKVLKDYPQVISFSGHSHYALCDERSIWQGEFTAINTQTVDYIELESGKYNGTIPRDAFGSYTCHYPTCMIMDITAKSVAIQRVAADTGKNMKDPWIISAPFGDKKSFTYLTDKRVAADAAPYFTTDGNIGFSKEKDKEGNGFSVIRFDAASDDDFVHSYILQFLDKSGNALSFIETNYDGTEKEKAVSVSEIKYFSDFTMGLENMSDRAVLRLPNNIPEDTVSVKITAVDTWGKTSKSITAPITEEIR